MDNNDSLARVSIFGHEYTVKAPADSTYIKNIAEYVDTKMREVQERPGSLATTGGTQVEESPDDRVFDAILGSDTMLEEAFGI